MYTMKGTLLPLDFLAVATLNRSLCLISGFCALIESKNIVAAAPLFRMQLDNCLRFSAAWIVQKPHEFARRVLDGVQIRRLKDQAGNLMTDGYLVQKLSGEHPWITSAYEDSSGYVHLSEKHIYDCICITSEAERTVNLKISDHDEFVPDRLYLDVIRAFAEATKIVLTFARDWANTKNNPAADKESKSQPVD